MLSVPYTTDDHTAAVITAAAAAAAAVAVTFSSSNVWCRIFAQVCDSHFPPILVLTRVRLFVDFQREKFRGSLQWCQHDYFICPISTLVVYSAVYAAALCARENLFIYY